MPVSPTAPPSVSTLSTPPNRATDSAAQFATKADTTMAEIPPMVTSQNSLASWQNTTAAQMYNNTVEANTAATNANNSANAAATSASFKGEWSSLSGALNKPATVSHKGAFWGLLNNLADVTLSEPSPTNANWKFKSGTRWVTYTATGTLNANSQNYIVATGAVTNLTQPSFTANDFIVISNSIDSTQTVRLLNPSNTIKGDKGTVTAGNDLVIPAGDTVHLVARTNTILETV